MGQKTKRAIKTRFFVILFLVVMLYAGYLFVKQQLKMGELNAQAAEIQQQIEQVDDANEQLERDIEYAQTDEYIESQARDKLGWVKEDEIKFIEKDSEGN